MIKFPSSIPTLQIKVGQFDFCLKFMPRDLIYLVEFLIMVDRIDEFKIFLKDNESISKN